MPLADMSIVTYPAQQAFAGVGGTTTGGPRLSSAPMRMPIAAFLSRLRNMPPRDGIGAGQPARLNLVYTGTDGGRLLNWPADPLRLS